MFVSFARRQNYSLVISFSGVESNSLALCCSYTNYESFYTSVVSPLQVQLLTQITNIHRPPSVSLASPPVFPLSTRLPARMYNLLPQGILPRRRYHKFSQELFQQLVQAQVLLRFQVRHLVFQHCSIPGLFTPAE